MKAKRTLTDFYCLRIALIGVATLLSVSIASAEALPEIDVAAAAAQIQDKGTSINPIFRQAISNKGEFDTVGEFHSRIWF